MFDNKQIYQQRVDVREKVQNVIVEKESTLIYFVDSKGIYLTDILVQIQNKKDLNNFVNFSNLNDDSPLELYQKLMGDYTSFPQMHNLMQLLSLLNLPNQIGEILSND